MFKSVYATLRKTQHYRLKVLKTNAGLFKVYYVFKRYCKVNFII